MRAEILATDDEPNGLASLLAGLLEANLTRRPERAALLRPAVVVIVAADAEVQVTVRLEAGAVRVSNGGTARPDLAVRARGHDLLALTAAPLRFGLPDPLTREGRTLLARIFRREVRISGIVRHPIVLSRVARLLSAR